MNIDLSLFDEKEREELTDEQKAVVTEAVKGFNNIIVQAVAGSGKTRTLRKCVEKLLSKKNKKILVLAHNRSVRDELSEKINGGDDTKNWWHLWIYTIHGLGMRLYTEHFKIQKGEGFLVPTKYTDYINKNISNIGGEEYASLNDSQKMNYKSHLYRLVDLARINLMQSPKEIGKIAERYGISLVSNECETVSKILKWGVDNWQICDYQDLLTFPSEFGYRTKERTSDYILLDEAQDVSPAQEDVIRRCMTRNTKLIAFGDSDQSINGWCGADTNAFKTLSDSHKFNRPAKQMTLSVNFRCPKNVIEYSKKYTDKDEIVPREDAENGVVNFMASVADVKNGDMVLCRRISPLMDMYRRLLSQGVNVKFQSSEMGNGIKALVNNTKSDTLKGIISELKSSVIFLWHDIQRKYGISEFEASKDSTLMSNMDMIRTLECVPENVITRSDLNNFMQIAFPDTTDNDGNPVKVDRTSTITLSTVHRAKGLESDNVFVICPSLMPDANAIMDWEKDEEVHLQYVMSTRPKKSLNFISEKEIRAENWYSDKHLLCKKLQKMQEELTI